MASISLYPPIVDSYMPAFIAGTSSFCRIYFTFSKFNSFDSNYTVHATVTRASTGLSVVNDLQDSIGHYRKTGTILNLQIHQYKDNLYYVDIENADLKSISNGYQGWIPGWIYKVQIRLCDGSYIDGSNSQSTWMNNNASNFSEWSTQCIVKAIGDIDINIKNLNAYNISLLDDLDFIGSYSCTDNTESLYSYRVKLYEQHDASNSTLREDSGIVLSEKNIIRYKFKYECEDLQEYRIVFEYETQNKYSNTLIYKFKIKDNSATIIDIQILTLENAGGALDEITSLQEENDEGRITLKLHSDTVTTYTGTLCVRRSDSRTNFKTWEDIKIINFDNTDINDFIHFYDYIIESGVYYKYGVLAIDSSGDRGKLNITDNNVIRDFNYSFLLGEDNQQLKLMFDNKMSSYKISTLEGKLDPLGSKFGVITRNGNTYYQSFPIEGLISFNMDESELFATRAGIYGNQTLANLYEQYRKQNYIDKYYDTIFEREFRKVVLAFLYNGKPKLFKSPTEGNIVVRLMEINCTPQQSLSRLIYSFSSNAHEIADATIENYLQYKFCKLEEENG